VSCKYTALLISLSLAGPALADTGCEKPKDIAELISATAAPLAPARFDSIRGEMTMWQIVRLLGPASREVGSGLMILAWQSTDGRTFLVGGPSLCERPFYARFMTVAE
jgi:hypothetical protein